MTHVFLFQFICKQCQRGYHDARSLRCHQYACVYCEKCKSWVEKRHIERCQASERVRKGARIVCPLCRRLRSKAGMYRHWQKAHGMTKWNRKEHPEAISEVILNTTVSS